MRLLSDVVDSSNQIFLDNTFPYNEEVLSDPIKYFTNNTRDISAMLSATLPFMQSSTFAGGLLGAIFGPGATPLQLASEENAIAVYSYTMGKDILSKYYKAKSLAKMDRNDPSDLNSVIMPAEVKKKSDYYLIILGAHTHPIYEQGSNQFTSALDNAYVMARRMYPPTDIFFSCFYPFVFSVVNVISVDMIENRKVVANVKASEIYDLYNTHPNASFLPREFNALWLQDAMLMDEEDVYNPVEIGRSIYEQMRHQGLMIPGIPTEDRVREALVIYSNFGIAASMRYYRLDKKEIIELGRIDGSIPFYFPAAMLRNDNLAFDEDLYD